jgi:hypothetical protein
MSSSLAAKLPRKGQNCSTGTERASDWAAPATWNVMFGATRRDLKEKREDGG